MKKWENFSDAELTCHCGCGRMLMDEEFMEEVVRIRRALDIPLPVTSAFRCPVHNYRVSPGTKQDGPHTTGKAIDIRIHGKEALALVRLAALSPVIRGIGINQRGPVAQRFIHIDSLTSEERSQRPNIWSY
ncbi:MAG: DUF882 domain-containing protein [bacterium]|nr:DUF882 domain-containing protein [bacterium]